MKITELVIQSKLPPGYELIDAGEVNFPTGEVAAGDPFQIPGAPLKQKIIPGNNAVNLLYKDCKEWGYRVAAAFLNISKEPIDHWSKANDNFGMDTISVDSGLACIADLRTAADFQKLLKVYRSKEIPENYYDAVLSKELSKKVLPGERTNFFGIHHPFGDKRSLAIFECGMGDGSYKMQWAFDIKKNPVLLAIDFNILNLE